MTQRYIIESLFGWSGDDIESAKVASFYDSGNSSIIARAAEDIGWMTVVRRADGVTLEHLSTFPIAS